MILKNNFDLISLNTFKLASVARYFAELTDISDIPDLIAFAKKENVSIKFLGGGSNVILPTKINALVIKNSLLGSQITCENDQQRFVACSSGENWHQFVLSSLKLGHFGLENLALIPGTVGGAPIQNIGAYGVEVDRFIKSVVGYDFETGTQRTLSADECGFSYRHSIFKTPAFKTFFISSVEFQFPKHHTPVISYAELEVAFKGKTPIPSEVAQKVIEIRQNKLPDVSKIPNVGSFFKNPIVSADRQTSLKKGFPDLVSYPQPDGQYKLAAGQLIDKLGYKGKKEGTVGMYEKQALVMVNLGHGRIEDIMKLVGQISIDCYNQFGVRLEAEPVFW